MTQQFVELSEIIAKGTGSINPASYVDEHFELYSIPAFDAGEPEAKTGAEIGSSKQIVKPGDVLLSKIVPHIRRSWIVGPATGKRIIASSEWIVFRGERFSPKYLRHVLVGDPFHLQFMNTVAGVGGSLLRARPAHVAKIKIPLPPLSEQKRIAEILDRAEALRAKRRAALALLDELTQSIFLDMFGDPVTNPKGWEMGTIKDLLESASYGTSEKSESVGEFPVLRMNNISRTGEMDFTDLKYMDLKSSEHDRYLVRSGDVLFNRTNSAELVGKTGLFREARKMAYAGYLIRLRTNDANEPEYLSVFLNSAYAKKMLRGMCKSIIGMANINATEIQCMRVAMPPNNLQRSFAARVSDVEKLKTVLRNSLAELDQLFASLQHRAFRGEL